jgi:16S rRNA (uracil1498-N3)-methyltransferase
VLRFNSDIPALFHRYDLNEGQIVRVDDDEHRHLRAIRARIGGSVMLLDGRGRRAECIIEGLERRESLLRVERIVFDEGESRPYIAVGIGLLADKTRFEWCLEKLVELGATAIVPLITERSEGRFYRERFERIMIAALKQSQRSWLPDLPDPIPFDSFLDQRPPDDHLVLCHERASVDRSLTRFLLRFPPQQRLTILVGPEGGFSDSELEFAEARSASIVWLSDARLRSETAAVASLVLAGSLMRRDRPDG